MRIRLVSLMAENSSFFYRELAPYLSARTGFRVETINDVPWWEREQLLDRGEAHLGFICGLHYTLKAAAPRPGIRLLAAPVFRAPRYSGKPVYFSDVVVRRDSSRRAFRDLRGAAWAYNEPRSHSGYAVVRWHLTRLGETAGYFGRVVEAGAHQRALRMVAEGEVDAAAIDSSVLELELEQHPGLASGLRVIETLGPSPAPPAVLSAGVPEAAGARLRAALLEMHRDPAGCRLLGAARLRRYVPAGDMDYEPIRRMAREGEPVPLAAPPAESRAPGGLRPLPEPS